MYIDPGTGILKNEAVYTVRCHCYAILPVKLVSSGAEAVHREMSLLYCPQIPKAHREMYIVLHALLLTSETP